MKTSDGQFESGKPINEIVLPYDQIKAYDVDTEMSLELHSENEKQNVNSLAFFVLANDKDEFTSVTDYSVDEGVVKFKIPKIDEDKYYPQIMDNTGKVYSSANGVSIDVVYNPQSRALEIFPIIKQQVIDAVTPKVKQYVVDNADMFVGERGLKGDKGDKGEKGDRGLRGFTGNRGPKGDTGSVELVGGFVDNSMLDSVVYSKILDAGTNADSLDVPGFYTVTSGVRATEELNFPPGNQLGVLNVRDLGSGTRTQTYTMPSAGEIWTRRRYVGNWSEWLRVGDKTLTPLAGDNDLDTLTSTGEWKQTHTPYVTDENNYPPISGEFKGGILNVFEYGGTVTQTYIADRSAEMWVRDRLTSGSWFEWKRLDGNIKENEKNSLPVTRMEITGKWTPNDDGDKFLLEMGEHELVETIEIGRTVHDRPLYAAIIGDKTKPALLVNAGAHGTEVGPPEGAWLWVRELTKNKSLMLMDMCIIVVPNQNPDNRFIARGNKNAVDLNRDWVDFSQPETQAVKSLFDTYNVIAGLDMHNFGYPRHTSLQEVTFGSEEVKTKSQEMYDAVFSALENDNQLVRRYAPAMDERSFTNGVAIAYDIPTLIIEIPSGGYNDWTFDHYIPTPLWQSHIFMLSCNAVAKYVWENFELN